MEQALLVVTNLPDAHTAQALAQQLVQQKLAACVSSLPGVHSIYRWQGAIEEVTEVTLLIKTVQARYAELESAIKAAHPYAVPEIIAIPISACLPEYFAWVVQQTKKDVHV